jgi:anthranilate phosphoribosyltransferase/anthranilate synthase/phosphoribosyltransferase
VSSLDFKPVLQRVATGIPLTEAESEQIFGAVMEGHATTAQIAGLLMALQVRGETVPEFTGLVRAMRARMTEVTAPSDAIDVCGTGGDGAGTLNISTAVSFVLAGLGVPVAKHGNRALSSRTGAADVLTALGVNVDVPLAQLPALLETHHCAFLFAPRHHPALRHAAEARRELGLRTIFNLAGPMANPARVTRQLIGVFDPAWGRPMAEALRELGSEKVWLVHGMGLDELTLAGDNQVVELDKGNISVLTLSSRQAGLAPAPIEAIRGGDAAFNARALRGLLAGVAGAYRDTVLLNAAAALIVAGRTNVLTNGVALAIHSIDSGAAQTVLDQLIRATNAPNHPK